MSGFASGPHVCVCVVVCAVKYVHVVELSEIKFV